MVDELQFAGSRPSLAREGSATDLKVTLEGSGLVRGARAAGSRNQDPREDKTCEDRAPHD